MRVTKANLLELGVSAARVDRYLPDLRALLPEHDIDTPLRLAHFLAQVLHESGLLRIVEENLNYSAEGLRRIFPRYFTPAQAQRYARQPQAIASRVYGGRLGNGDEASGDGWRFRGRGLIQLTGRDNYRALADWLADDVVAAPDSVAARYAVHGAVFYWTRRVDQRPRRRRRRARGDPADQRRLHRACPSAYACSTPPSARSRTRRRPRWWTPPTSSPPRSSTCATRRASRPRPASRRLPQGTPVAVLEPAADGWVRVRVVSADRSSRDSSTRHS